MAEAAIVKQENNHECPICTEEYRDARVLECGHHFCRVCLEEIATGHPDGHVTCPTCRHITNTTGKDDISKLQKYSLINDFVGSVNGYESFSKTAAPNNVKTCDICEDQASKYCVQCHLVYCDKCLSDHEDLPEHKLYLITSSMFCKPHQDYAVSYCKTCHLFCCGKCLITKHKLHSKCSIEIAEKTAKEQLLQSSKELQVNCDEEELLNNVMKAIDIISTQKNDISTGFNELEITVESLLAKIKNVGNQMNEIMDAELKKLGMIKVDLNDFTGSKAKLIKMTENLLKEVTPHELIAKYESLPKYRADMIDHLNHCKTSKIPILGVSFDKTTQTLKEIEESLSPTLQELNLTSAYKGPITNVTLINTFKSHQTGGAVWGIIADVEKKQLVVRRKDQQEPITIFDYDGKKKGSLGTGIAGIKGELFQGIDIDTKRGFYVLPVAGDIMLMDKQGNITGQFKVSNKTIHGICYNKDKDVYITCSHSDFGGDDKVYIINAAERNVISSFLSITSFGIASREVYVKDTNKHVIAVTGHYKHCVKVYDFQGNVLYTIGVEGKSGSTDGYFNLPWGVCIDPSGRIIVCNESRKKVVSVDDKSWKQLLSVTHDALHVTFDPSAKRLFVADNNSPITIHSY